MLYILNVTQENTGPVTVSGAINRDLVTNINQPVPVGYLTPGMALLCIDTGSELRLLSYGDAETIAQAAEDAAARAEDAAAVAESAAGGLLSNFDTASAVAAANIPGPVNYARTAGYSTVGDGGAALYKRVGANPNVGPALQTNGSFASDTGWTKVNSAVIADGKCTFSGTSATIAQTIAGMAGVSSTVCSTGLLMPSQLAVVWLRNCSEARIARPVHLIGLLRVRISNTL